MIPESDQIFTEVELSTLEKAINETTVTEARLILGGWRWRRGSCHALALRVVQQRPRVPFPRQHRTFCVCQGVLTPSLTPGSFGG